MNAEATPTLWLIAGPNGVGKTWFAMARLEAVSGSINFVNIDEIARGFSPLRPAAAQVDAGRAALARAGGFITGGKTFAWETTLSGGVQKRFLKQAAERGFRTALLYFSARDPEICLERVARRVAEGGHDVSRNDVVRRFHRSLGNLPAYVALADLWRVYEASGPKPVLAVEGSRAVVTFKDDEALAMGHSSLSIVVGSRP